VTDDDNVRQLVEEALRQPGLPPLPPPLGALYKHRLAEPRRASSSRLLLTLAAFTLLADGIDWMNQHALAYVTLPWRVLVTAFLLACAYLIRRVRVPWHETVILALSMFAIILSTQYFGEIGPARFTDRYMMAASFAAAVLIATAQATRRTAWILAAVSILADPLVPWLIGGPVHLPADNDLLLFHCGAVSFALLLMRRNETARRRDFLHAMRHEFSAADMKSLIGELTRLSTTDGLTGLANRRHLDSEMSRLWRSAQGGHQRNKLGRDIGVALIDIDHFKKFNDSAGHAAGDECLRQVAHVLAQVVRRDHDLPARYGGEEFCVVLPGIAWQDLLDMGERLRRAVADLEVPHPGLHGTFVTISVGLAWHRAAARVNVEHTLRAADAALYAAKAAGRNCVAASADDPAIPGCTLYRPVNADSQL
jgi:diguanylate cyclase (GGDEF)-like protein